jgi:prophage DNA circulation protein
VSFFSENLLGAQLGDVVYDATNRTVDFGREYARIRYPYRSGQGVEDLGRKIYIFKMEVPLYRGVRESDYPKTSDALLALVTDETKKGEQEYIDPEFGAFNVKIADVSWSIDATRTDGGTMTLTLEERDFEQDLLGNLGKGALSARGKAAQASASTDYVIDVFYQVNDEENTAGFSLTDAWAKAQDAIDTVALGADQVAAQIDEFVLVATKAYNFSPADEIARFTITNAAIDAIGFALDVGDDVATGEIGSKILEVALPSTMSIYEIAQRYYGDPGRAEDVALINSFANPLAVPTGTKVLVAP